MKKTIIFAAAACLLMSAVSCQKENNETLAPENKTVFTGIIENTTTRTTIGAVSDNKCKVYWEETDHVSINGSSFDVVPNGDDASVATFTGGEAASPYIALYPFAYYQNEGFVLPATYYYYTAGSFNHIPMYAYSTTKELTFKNIFAVVKVSVDATVTKVVVSSDVNLNGIFTVASDVATITENASKTTTINCDGDGITGDIYIPVPAADYSGQNLRVTITKSDDTTETMSTKQTATIQLNANEIIAFTFTKNSFNLISTTKKSTLL